MRAQGDHVLHRPHGVLVLLHALRGPELRDLLGRISKVRNSFKFLQRIETSKYLQVFAKEMMYIVLQPSFRISFPAVARIKKS